MEHRQEHELTQEIAATGEAVRLLHDGLRDVDRGVTRVDQRLDQVASEVGAVARSQIEHGGALAQLAGKVDGLEGKVDRLDHKVDGLSGRVGALEHKVDAQGQTLAGHGEALGRLESAVAEILRRLPAAGE